MLSSSYDAWLERQREKHEAPLGYCQVCGETADYTHRWSGGIARFCIDHDQEPPDDVD